MRLIDADAFAEFLKDAVKRQKYGETKIDELLTVADVIDAVISELEGISLAGFKNAPTIEPEIVRCKECINHGKEICYFWSRFYGTINTPDDGFCHKAERRTDETN